MSKSKNDESIPGMSPESIGFLADTKKGKSRKFAMICKGVSVVSLVIYKKGGIENRKKEAKESGKGQFYFGVVDGQGMDIRFVLARADGFETEPVKRTALKDFLEENAGLKCKPYFEIVDTAPIVLDEDDPIVVRFRSLQPAATAACETRPDHSSEIKALVQQISGHLDQDQPNEAVTKLDQLEKLLAGIAPGPTPPEQVDQGLASKLADALKKLQPLLEKAIGLHPKREEELSAAFRSVGSEIEQGQLEQAQGDLVSLGKLLKSLIAEPPKTVDDPSTPNPSPTSVVDDSMRQKLQEALNKLVPQLKQAVADFPNRKAELLAPVSQIKQQLESGDLQNAKQGILSVSQLLKSLVSASISSGKTDSGSENDGAARYKALDSRWQAGILSAHAEIQKIIAPITLQVPEEDPQLLLTAITKYFDSFVEEISQAILGIQAANSTNVQPIQEALKSIQSFRSRAAADPLLLHLSAARTDLGVDVNVNGVLTIALNELEQSLAS